MHHVRTTGILFIALISGSYLSEMIATSPTSVQPSDDVTVRDLSSAEMHVWQGKLVAVEGDDLVIRVAGELETFDVGSNTEIRRNGKECELRALAPRDFVAVATASGEAGKLATRVCSCSVR